MRLEYIDRLRNLGILALFPFHTARVFDASESFYVQGRPDPLLTTLIPVLSWLLPLLFVLAGMAGRYSLGVRTLEAYVRERRRRLLYPFLFGIALIVPPQAYYATLHHGGDPGGPMAFLRSYYTDLSDWSEYEGGFALGHLWFILLLYGLATLLLPLIGLIERRDPSSGPLNHPIGMVALPGASLAVLALIPGVLGKNLVVFAAFFVLGHLLVRDPATMEAVVRRRLPHLFLGLVGVIGLLTESLTVGSGQSPLSDSWRTALCWAAVLAVLGYGRRYMDRGTAFDSYFSPAAFPVYVLHQTFLVIIAHHVIARADHGGWPFLAIMTGSLVASLVGYELARRARWTRFVLGIPERTRPRRSKASPTG
ncbi:acyltransferase family protein [Nocardiopsis alba]|uniref:acyltransferase family protein n=1 Tax=Nocardiopsis alba TaxID=53437 RepID=UPI0005AAAAA7|nr:acyltransferase [Nocardiopsis alba]